MPSKKVTTFATYGILSLAAVVSFMLPDSLPTIRAAEAPDPNALEITGIIRDFWTTHPDFSGVAAGGYGHVAGNVNVLLPGNGAPAFNTGGYRVTGEWRDANSRNIAPHMYKQRGGISAGERLGLRLDDKITLKDETNIDAFNSNFGPYGVAGNYGSGALVSTNAIGTNDVHLDKKAFIRGDVFVGPVGNPDVVIGGSGLIYGRQDVLTKNYTMPDDAVMPDDTAGYVATKDMTGAVTLTGDVNDDDDADVNALWYGTLNIKPGAVVTIVGNLRIRCDTAFTMDNAQIVLADSDAQLTIFVNGDVNFKHSALVNTDPGDSSAIVVNVLGSHTAKLDDKCHVYATIIGGAADLNVKGDSHFYGGFVGKTMTLEGKSAVHVDQANATLGKRNYALTVRDKIELNDHCTMDSFDSNAGPYGGANVGSVCLASTNSIKAAKVKLTTVSVINGTVLVGPGGSTSSVVFCDATSLVNGSKGNLSSPAAIPVVAPKPLGASIGDKLYTKGAFTINSNLHCKNLTLNDSAIVTVFGNITIRVDDKLAVTKNSQILLGANSTLKIYAAKDVKVEDHSSINTGGNPQNVNVYRCSTGKKGKVSVKNQSSMAAWIQGAKTKLNIEDQSYFAGSFIGDKVSVKKQSQYHVDMADLNTCVNVNDSIGTAGAASNGDITSAASFAQWFTDVPSVNISAANIITLTKNASGVYEYLNDAFHPIDGRMLGNEGGNNSQFTYSIAAKFAYHQCGGQFIEFAGGDGCWMFINNQLVMDLGGMGSTATQYVDMDRLGLSDGQIYEVDFFYAQRRASPAVFRLRTNIPLSTESVLPAVTAACD